MPARLAVGHSLRIIVENRQTGGLRGRADGSNLDTNAYNN